MTTDYSPKIVPKRKLEDKGDIISYVQQVTVAANKHAPTHQDAGNDEISVVGLSGLLADDQHVLDAEVLAVAAAVAHKTTHQNAGADEVSVAGLSGELADDQPPKTHAADHITSGSDEVDGDKLDIDFNPSNYTPATTPGEADSVDNLTAHLYGIDQQFAVGGVVAAAGNILLQSADTERNQVVGTYTKVKEIQLPIAAGGTYRVKFDLKHVSAAGSTGYGRVYRNGGVAGSERPEQSGSYVTKSQDISGWGSADLVQIYYYTDGANPVWVKNFRIYASAGETSEVLTD